MMTRDEGVLQHSTVSKPRVRWIYKRLGNMDKKSLGEPKIRLSTSSIFRLLYKPPPTHTKSTVHTQLPHSRHHNHHHSIPPLRSSVGLIGLISTGAAVCYDPAPTDTKPVTAIGCRTAFTCFITLVLFSCFDFRVEEGSMLF